jgi:hypothetical protein
MPIAAPLLGSIISGGASLLGNLFNIGSTNRNNQRQLGYNQQMYDRQRADALADWNMQNAYNSPSQQMQRFKEAGLNPNLIYGQMTNSPVVRSTDQKAPDFVAPKLDTNMGANALMNYYSIKGTEAQIKQQEASTQLIQEQARGKKLENENLIDQSPYLLEGALQTSRMKGQQVASLMQDIDNKRELNPLTREKLKQDIQSIAQSRLYQQLDYNQKAKTNDILRQAMEQGIRLNGNRYELDKLRIELQHQTQNRALNMTDAQSTDFMKTINDLLRIFYEPITYTGKFIK